MRCRVRACTPGTWYRGKVPTPCNRNQNRRRLGSRALRICARSDQAPAPYERVPMWQQPTLCTAYSPRCPLPARTYDIYLLSFPHTSTSAVGSEDSTDRAAVRIVHLDHIMAQYSNSQGHSHTWQPPVDTDAEYPNIAAVETSSGPVTSFSGMPDFPTEVTWPDLSTPNADCTNNDTSQTALTPVESFSGMPDFPTDVTWPEMSGVRMQYTGQPDSRGRYPRWRPQIDTPIAYSTSFNPKNEKNNCFFDTVGSIVGLSSVTFCELIGYKRDGDVGVIPKGE